MKLPMKVLIIIKCVFIGFCACEGKELILLGSNSNAHLLLNKNFKLLAKSGYSIHDVELNENGVRATVDASKYYNNIINLRVGSASMNELIKAGFFESDLVCVNCKFENKNNGTNKYSYEEPSRFEDTEDVRMFSSALLKDKYLIDIISQANDDNDTKSVNLIVIICLPQHIIDNNEVLKRTVKGKTGFKVKEKVGQSLSLEFKETCNSDVVSGNNVFAVLAEKPFNGYTKKPTLFYQTAFQRYEDEIDFPNSAYLLHSQHSMEYAFLEFLKYAQWFRIAMISDDSEQSQDFLEYFTNLLRKDGNFAFTSQECEERTCNFGKAIDNIRGAGARIIILNLDSKNAAEVTSIASNLMMLEETWLMREWVPSVTRPLLNIYSFIQFPIYGTQTTDDEIPYYSAISYALDKLHQIRNCNNNLNVEICQDQEELQRKFSSFAETLRPEKKTIIRVARLSRGRHTNVANITVIGSKATMVDFESKDLPTDGSEQCLFKSYDFYNPCDYEPLLMLMGVFIMFMFLLLIVLMFFKHYRDNFAYRRFN